MRTLLTCLHARFLLLSVIAAPVAMSAEAQPVCPRGNLPAYAHNDYENSRPLSDAIALGFRGVEADIFLVDDTLRVGHDKKSARHGGTLEDVYLQPLQELLTRCGHLVAEHAPFFLAIELKEQSAPAYDSLLALLDRHELLRSATRAVNGQSPRLTMVLVGWHPVASTAELSIDSVVGWQQRISRSLAATPLDDRVRLLSIDYGKTIGRWWVTPGGKRRWLNAILEAKRAAPDRLVRAHNVPVDQRVYAELFAAGVDLIGTKQLRRSAELLATPP